jgi:recombination protein RecA
MENSRRFLRDNPELAAELERLIKEKLGVGVVKPAEADAKDTPKLKAVDGF